MKEILDNEKINKIIEEADNNDYLFSLLYVCYSNGLKISNCTNGNKKKRINPSISFILDQNNIDEYRNIVGLLEDIPNIKIDTGYDLNENVEFKNKKILKITTYYHNRDEVFYKLSHMYDNKNIITSSKGIVFFTGLYNFICASQKEIESKIEDGMLVCTKFNTLDDSMIKHEIHNDNIILRTFNNIFSKNEYKKYDKEPQYKIKELK